MSAKYVISRQAAERPDRIVSLVRKNEVAFYPHFTGGYGTNRNDAI